MRKLYFLLIAFVAMAFTACNSDDDSDNSNSSEIPSITTIAGTYTGSCVYNRISKNDTIAATWTISNDSTLTVRNLPVKVFLGSASDSTITKTVDESQTVTITAKVSIYHTAPIAFHVAVNSPVTTTATYNGATHSLRIIASENQYADNGGMFDNNEMVIGIVQAGAYADGSNTNLLSKSAGFQLIGKKGNSPIIPQ